MNLRNALAEAIRKSAARLGRIGVRGAVRRSNRAARIIVDRFDSGYGIGDEWSPIRYAEYYITSAAVNAAVRVRAEAVGRPRLRAVISQTDSSQAVNYRPAGAGDPLQKILDRPNPVWTMGELLRATETYVCLLGSAYWGIERNGSGAPEELWPLRPDRVRVIPDQDRYVKGFVYENQGQSVAFLPDEVVWFRHVNPLDEFGGMSCLPPARLAVDMGFEALQFNRDFFRNSAMPGDLAITSENMPNDDEVSEFYARWESRFKGSGSAHRPVLLPKGMEAKRLGVSQRDMEFRQALAWPVEEVSRAFGVPKVFLGQLEDATLSNIRTLERFLWRSAIVPELRLIEEAINRSVTPHFEAFQGQLKVEFDLSEIDALKESENDRVDRQAKLVAAGVLTINEARAERNLPPLS